MSRILVTGGAGFIGSHLVESLIAAGECVTVLDDFSTGTLDNLADAAGGDLRILTGSVLDAAAVSEALEGCDRVYHLAVQCVRRSLAQPVQNHQINATGTLIVLEAARRHKISRFVYCSSSEVYGNTSTGLLDEENTVCRPVTIYGSAKLAAEHYTQAYFETYGLPCVIVRPFNAYGPRAHHSGDLAEVIPRFVIRVLSGYPPIIFGDGTQGRDFTYVTDVARGLVLAGASDRLVGRRVNIAYGRMVTILDVARVIMNACGRNDLDAELSSRRPGDVNMLRADTRLASSLLGYRATVRFEDGVTRYVNWFRTRHPDPCRLLEEQIENWSLPAAATEPFHGQGRL